MSVGLKPLPVKASRATVVHRRRSGALVRRPLLSNVHRVQPHRLQPVVCSNVHNAPLLHLPIFRYPVVLLICFISRFQHDSTRSCTPSAVPLFCTSRSQVRIDCPAPSKCPSSPASHNPTKPNAVILTQALSFSVPSFLQARTRTTASGHRLRSLLRSRSPDLHPLTPLQAPA